MVSVFISHSPQDRAIATTLCARMRAAGFSPFALDSGSSGVPSGRNWERELYAKLRRSDAVIFLASESSATSRWCFAEVVLARSLGRPVFPAQLTPGVQLPLLNDTELIDFADLDTGLARLLAGLRAAGMDPDDSFPWDARRSPYPGLAAFGAEDAAVFYGRQGETTQLMELLRPTKQLTIGRFVAIVGPTGSGKSSLLRAGLLPQLTRQFKWLAVLPPIVPGSTPIRNLAASLAQAFVSIGHPNNIDNITRVLQTESAGLRLLADELTGSDPDGAAHSRVLVVIDQAEELLTRTSAWEQRTFLNLLVAAIGEDSPVSAVATVRSEFLSHTPERAGLAQAIDDTLTIEPLSRAQLIEVIARPAARAGMTFAPGLIERMVEDTGGGDALSLLAYTLHELWERAEPGSEVTNQSYESLGGVLGALQRRAFSVYSELARRGHGETVIPTLLRLITVTNDDKPERRQLPRSALSSEEEQIVDVFINASLIVAHRASVQGDATVELVHDALFRQWSPLREAIEENRAQLRLRSELRRLAKEWQLAARDESYLLSGRRLTSFAEYARDLQGDELDVLEKQFLRESKRRFGRKDVRDKPAQPLNGGDGAVSGEANTVSATAWRLSGAAIFVAVAIIGMCFGAYIQQMLYLSSFGVDDDRAGIDLWPAANQIARFVGLILPALPSYALGVLTYTVLATRFSRLATSVAALAVAISAALAIFALEPTLGIARPNPLPLTLIILCTVALIVVTVAQGSAWQILRVPIVVTSIFLFLDASYLQASALASRQAADVRANVDILPAVSVLTEEPLQVAGPTITITQPQTNLVLQSRFSGAWPCCRSP